MFSKRILSSIAKDYKRHVNCCGLWKCRDVWNIVICGFNFQFTLALITASATALLGSLLNFIEIERFKISIIRFRHLERSLIRHVCDIETGADVSSVGFTTGCLCQNLHHDDVIYVQEVPAMKLNDASAWRNMISNYGKISPGDSYNAYLCAANINDIHFLP